MLIVILLIGVLGLCIYLAVGLKPESEGVTRHLRRGMACRPS
jgi:hypothetical protein